MKKKVVILTALLLVVHTSGAFVFSLSLQHNGNASDVFTSGVAVTFKADSIPLNILGKLEFCRGLQSVVFDQIF